MLDSGWQELDRVNDDAIDAIILLRRRGRDTGGLVFVQIKCGNKYRVESKKRPNHIGVLVGDDYINNHMPRWTVIPGPVILVYIDPATHGISMSWMIMFMFDIAQVSATYSWP